MPNTIILKKSSVASKVPLVGDLVFGELALNYADGRLYYKTSGNGIDFVNNGGTFTNRLTISNITNSLSTATGALVVTGGVGVGGSLFAGNVVGLGNGSAGATVEVRAANGTYNINLISRASQGSYNPLVAANDSLIYWSQGAQGSGNLVLAPWSNTSTGVRISNLGVVSIPSTVQSSSTVTGALQVAGGVGIGGNLYVGGEIVAQRLTIQLTTVTTTNVTTDDIISTYNTTNATSTITGALTVAGGAGIGRDLWVGGKVYSEGIALSPFKIQEYSASAGQTTFAVTNGYTTGTVQVFANGVLLGSSNFTATDGSNVVLTTPRFAGDVIRILAGSAGGAISIFNGGTITSTMVINNSTSATSTTTGALQVVGGVGIGGNVYSNGTVYERGNSLSALSVAMSVALGT